MDITENHALMIIRRNASSPSSELSTNSDSSPGVCSAFRLLLAGFLISVLFYMKMEAICLSQISDSAKSHGLRPRVPYYSQSLL